MEEEKQRVVKINNELKALADTSTESEHWSKRSIYRIPTSMTNLNKSAYKPQIVSFGPYHHDTETLKAMEEHKHRALLHFLKRAKKPLQSFVEALAPIVQDLKEAYDQLDKRWIYNTDAFLELMIVDGCFILELLRATMVQTNYQSEAQTQHPQTNSQISNDQDYASNDPIFGKHSKAYIVPHLKRDMLMLENQIPMAVLEKLVSVQNDESLKKGKELIKLILKFFSQMIYAKHLPQFVNCLHILDVYRKSLLLEPPRPRKTKTKGASHPIRQGGDEIIPSATELNEAGISIHKSRTRSLKDITFRGGVLRLPLIVVDDGLESLYLNLIAFERFHVGYWNEVTSYVFFMDNIIGSARDVSLLHSCGIVQNALSSDEALANLFHSLSKDITLDPNNTPYEVLEEVISYCRRPWSRWRAKFMRIYHNDPWFILSFLQIILFVLTVLQTVYTILTYVHQPPSS